MDTLSEACVEFNNLIKAAKRGQRYEVEKALAGKPWLAKGFDDTGWTALMWAVRYKNISCVKALLPASDPLAVGKGGNTALMLAALSGHDECVEALLPAADCLHKNVNGMTALDLARKYHHEKIALAIEKRKIAAEAAVEAAEIAEHIGAAPSPQKPARL